MLDSDVMGPDSRLAVKFYQREMPNDFETAKEGRPVHYMADFVRIEVPGDRNTIIDTFANQGHKDRFPIQWAQYQNAKRDGGDMDVQGTLLRDWPLLTSAQATELKHFKFYTVEQIAAASDDQIQRLGMMVGMSPYAFRDKAKAYLTHAKDSSVVQAQADELRKRDEEIAALKAQMEEITRAMQEAAPRRGRRPQEDKEAA